MGLETAERAVHRCPHCRAELAAPVDSWNGWRLCPRCGHPGPPPERPSASGADAPSPRVTRSATPASGVFVTRPAAGPAPGPAGLIAVAAFMAVGAAVAFVSYLGRLSTEVVLMGLAALLLFGLLIRVSGRRKR